MEDGRKVQSSSSNDQDCNANENGINTSCMNKGIGSGSGSGGGNSISKGRIQIRRIDNKASRQVTFSKRRNGLLKKAHELSVLCDAEVAVIIFSCTSKLFDFSSTSMKQILERYQRTTQSKYNNFNHGHDLEQYWKHEAMKMEDEIRFLQLSLSQFMGENLSTLPPSALQYLENKLHTGLGKVRSKMNQVLADQIHELNRQVNKRLEENHNLRRKISEMAMRTTNRASLSGSSSEAMGTSVDNMLISGGNVEEPTTLQDTSKRYKPAQPTLQLGLELFPQREESTNGNEK